MRWIRAVVLFSMLIGVAAAQAPPTPLQQGTPIERSINGSQTHTYTVTTEEKRLVQLTLEQRGVDVVVSVFSPAGKKLGEYDTPNGTDGPENVSFVVVEQGAYRIDIKPLQVDAPSGRYEIKIGEIRDATEDELKAGKNLETLKARALTLLDDIEAIIAELRVPQSRIKAQVQTANLLWGSDEKRAMKYMSDAIAGFKEVRMAAEANIPEYFRMYGEISQLRYEMAYLLMGRQPEMALNFVRSTPPLPEPYANPYYERQERVNQQTGLEIEIANHMARTDPKRALEVAREILKSGYSANLISTIEIIRQQKPEMAAELAGEIADKLLNEKLLRNNEAMNVAVALIRIVGPLRRAPSSERNAQSGRTQLLSDQQKRDLVQKLVNEVMNYKPPAGYSPERDRAWNMLRSLQAMGPDLDGVLTGGAAALEKRGNELAGGHGDPNVGVMQKLQNEIGTLPPDEAVSAVARAPKEFQENLYVQLANRVAAGGDTAKAKQILNDNLSNVYQRWQALRQIEQQDTHRAMSKGKIEEALRTIANIPFPEERASMINQIIEQIGPGHKRAAALNYLEQARALFSPSVRAQGQAQMGALCAIAKVFSRYDEKRAFEIMDPLVDQTNDFSDAARVLQGVGGDFYVDDELSFSNGNAVAGAASAVTQAIGTLALANFDRAKLMSDRIKLPEIRLRAYLEIAQQALQATR